MDKKKEDKHRDGVYDSQNIWVPDCSFQNFCVSRDSSTTHFCPCLIRLGAQERNQRVKVYCDLIREDTYVEP